jgi:outer membrane biosynthesis protein TonB
MRRGIVGSAVLHASILGATFVAWSSTRAPSDEPSQIIPVEMVEISDTTNIKPTVAEEPKPVEQPEEAVPPAPEPEPQQTAEAAAEEAPPPPPEESEKPAEPTPKPPPQKPQPPKPTANFDPDRILALLDKRAPRAAAPAAAPRAQRTQRGIGNMDAATQDIQAAFLQQMRECWNFPAGAPNPEELIVEMNIRLAPDGNLIGNPELVSPTDAEKASNGFRRAAADAALRAVHTCQPYQLPQDRYAKWRELNLVFDPSRMVGR